MNDDHIAKIVHAIRTKHYCISRKNLSTGEVEHSKKLTRDQAKKAHQDLSDSQDGYHYEMVDLSVTEEHREPVSTLPYYPHANLMRQIQSL